MDLGEINVGILRSLCRLLKIPETRRLSPVFLSQLCRKLSQGAEREGTVDALFRTLATLGISLSHINQTKVLRGDPVHLYLLLDFLSLLLTSLRSDNPEAALSEVIRGHPETGVCGGGSPTSGAEEVDRILTEARRRYGQIRGISFRKNIDAQNISAIAKPKEGLSEADKAEVKSTFPLPLRQKRFSGSSGKEQQRGKQRPISTATSTTEESATTSSRASTSSSSKTTGTSTSSSSTPIAESEEVNVRIPLEEASINLRIRSRDRDRPLAGRRIHVRISRATSPKQKKPGSRHIVYGGKSLLMHHHRKAGPPLFSRPPANPKLTSKQVVDLAVEEVRQARVKRAARDKRGREETAVVANRAKRPNLEVECQLATQKYLRDVRTEHAQLKKSIASLR